LTGRFVRSDGQPSPRSAHPLANFTVCRSLGHRAVVTCALNATYWTHFVCVCVCVCVCARIQTKERGIWVDSGRPEWPSLANFTVCRSLGHTEVVSCTLNVIYWTYFVFVCVCAHTLCWCVRSRNAV